MELTGDRVVLREFLPTDRDAVHAYAGDPQVTRFMHWGPNSEAETDEFLRSLLADAEQRTELTLAVTVTGAVLGAVSLTLVDEAHRRGTMGYVLARSCWGRGYATEAAGLVLRHGFDAWGLHRVEATCHPDNVASARVLEKIGMRPEGRMRGHLRYRDGWRDSLLFAALASD